MKPSRVSEILKPYAGYENIPADVLRAASERGTRRHAACSSIALGVPILRKDPADEGYVHSFKEWLDRYVIRAVLVSQRLEDPKLGFSGEPDLLLEIAPIIKEIKPGDLVIIDLKPEGPQQLTWRPQVAAYLHLAQANGYSARIGASLQPDQEGGPAKLNWYHQSPHDFTVFLNCLSAWNFFYGGKNAKET